MKVQKALRRIVVTGLVWMSAVGFSASLHAQQQRLQEQKQIHRVNYVCDLNGSAGQLTADIEAIQQVLVVYDPITGKMISATPTGEVNYHYGGQLVSSSSRYTFSGTNEYADFVDHVQGQRFRVRLIVEAQRLLMIINPQGPGPTQHMCQMSGAPQPVGGQQQPGFGGGVPQYGSAPPQPGFGPGVPQYGPAPQQPGFGPGVPQSSPAPQQPSRMAADLDRMMAIEREDFGVAATRQLHNGEMYAPTPNTIPGGQVVTTKGLVALVQKSPVPVVLIDALEIGVMLPEAIPAAWSASPGSFDDQTQQRLVQMLQQLTKGNKEAALVFYGDSRECWEAYNAALRAINAGYINVLWYRGGLQAWISAGLPTQPPQAPARNVGPALQQISIGR